MVWTLSTMITYQVFASVDIKQNLYLLIKFLLLWTLSKIFTYFIKFLLWYSHTGWLDVEHLVTYLSSS